MADVLVFGLGQVGQAVVRSLQALDISVCGLGHDAVDITKEAVVRGLIKHYRPRVVVNTAANTSVDAIETEPLQAINALRVNGWAPGHIADACHQVDALFVHLSSDYVYSGVGMGLLREDQEREPVNKYGLTKAVGDARVRVAGGRHIILLTEWVYAESGRNFLTRMLRLFSEQPVIKVVDDQFGSPTSAASLARAISWLTQLELSQGVPANLSGVYHWADTGGDTAYVSWFEFAHFLWWQHLRADFKCQEVQRADTSDFPRPAARPENSRLSTERFRSTFGLSPAHWRDEAARHCKMLKT